MDGGNTAAGGGRNGLARASGNPLGEYARRGIPPVISGAVYDGTWTEWAHCAKQGGTAGVSAPVPSLQRGQGLFCISGGGEGVGITVPVLARGAAMARLRIRINSFAICDH